MRGPAIHPIVVAAGGTGGHFFPAEALADALLSRGHRIVLMCDARSGGLRSDVFAGRERFVIAGAGLSGRNVLRAARGAVGLARGVGQAWRILTRLDAAALVGFGGYPSVAPVLGARLLRARRPAIILHEQNAVLGRANRALATRADLLALSFPATARVPRGATVAMVGNPIRPTIAAAPYEAPGDEIRILVLGGSLGARVLSDIVPHAILRLPDAIRARVRVVQQCRAEDIARVRDAYAPCRIEAELSPFFDDVSARLAAAHLVIARAGASTVAELAVVGRPAILVPLPHAIDDHQTANARAMADAGAGWIMPQYGFDVASLSDRIARLVEMPAVLSGAARAAASLAHPDAAHALADSVQALVARRVR